MVKTITYSPTTSISIIIFQSILIIYLIYQNNISNISSQTEIKELIETQKTLLQKKTADRLAQISTILIKEPSVSKCRSHSELIEEFREIGNNPETDKVNGHNYQHLYGVVLAPIRENKINMLEIGLGCNMAYGPGRSLQLWRKYFTHPETEISYLEYDRPCAEKFNRTTLKKLFIGDQADFKLLEQVGKEGGPYDLIVDDGGHKMSHMINSFIGLWPHLKNGGIYVIEDMHTTFDGSYKDRKETIIDVVTSLLIILSHGPTNLMPVNSNLRVNLEMFYKTIYHVDCYEDSCAFFKKL